MKNVKIILASIIIACICSLLFMFIWNWVIPNIFGLPTISFLQSLGLIALIDVVYAYIHVIRDKKDEI